MIIVLVMKKLKLILAATCLSLLTLVPSHASPANNGDQETSVQATEKRMESAIFDEEIIVDGPLHMSRRIGKGFAAFRAGDYAAAEKHFRRVRNIEKFQANFNNDVLREFVGNTNMSSFRVDLRSSDQQELEVIAILYYMEGLSQALRGEIKWAKTSFRKAMRYNPRHFDARADYALLEIETGGLKKAAKHLEKLTDTWLGCRDVPAGTCEAVGQRLSHVEAAYAQAFAE